MCGKVERRRFPCFSGLSSSPLSHVSFSGFPFFLHVRELQPSQVPFSATVALNFVLIKTVWEEPAENRGLSTKGQAKQEGQNGSLKRVSGDKEERRSTVEINKVASNC